MDYDDLINYSKLNKVHLIAIIQNKNNENERKLKNTIENTRKRLKTIEHNRKLTQRTKTIEYNIQQLQKTIKK